MEEIQKQPNRGFLDMARLSKLTFILSILYGAQLVAFPNVPLFEETTVDLQVSEKRCRSFLKPVIDAIKTQYKIEDLIGECVAYQADTTKFGIHILGMVPVPKFLTDIQDGQTNISYIVEVPVKSDVKIYQRSGNKLVSRTYTVEEIASTSRSKVVNFRFFDQCEDYRQEISSSLKAGVVSFCIQGNDQSPGAYVKLTPANIVNQ